MMFLDFLLLGVVKGTDSYAEGRKSPSRHNNRKNCSLAVYPAPSYQPQKLRNAKIDIFFSLLCKLLAKPSCKHPSTIASADYHSLRCRWHGGTARRQWRWQLSSGSLAVAAAAWQRSSAAAQPWRWRRQRRQRRQRGSVMGAVVAAAWQRRWRLAVVAAWSSMVVNDVS